MYYTFTMNIFIKDILLGRSKGTGNYDVSYSSGLLVCYPHNFHKNRRHHYLTVPAQNYTEDCCALDRWGQVCDMLPYLQAAYFLSYFFVMRMGGIKIIE